MKKLLILYPFLLFCLISKADNQLKLGNKKYDRNKRKCGKSIYAFIPGYRLV